MNQIKWLLLPILILGGNALAHPDSSLLQVGVHPFPPFIIQTEEGNLNGLCVDLWEDLADELGGSYRYVVFNDPIGMIRTLDFGEIDISINPLHVNSTRLDMFEVSQPFFVSSVGVATTSVARGRLQVFLRNFFSLDFLKIILLLLFIIFCFGALLWAVERRHNRFQFRSGFAGLLDGLWWAAVTMTTVGYGDKAPRTQAGKTVAIVWMFTAVIIISGFTATIASTLTVNSLAAKIERLQDIRSVDRIGTVSATSSEDFLVSHEIIPTHTYEDALPALRALARQEIDIVVYDRTVMRYLIQEHQLNGKIQLLSAHFNNQYRSFLMPRGSRLRQRLDPPLVRRINRADWQEVLRKYGLERNE